MAVVVVGALDCTAGNGGSDVFLTEVMLWLDVRDEEDDPDAAAEAVALVVGIADRDERADESPMPTDEGAAGVERFVEVVVALVVVVVVAVVVLVEDARMAPRGA